MAASSFKRREALVLHPACMTHHMKATPILDYEHPSIAALITERGWRHLDVFNRIGAVYNFVRDEISFGYNAHDDLPASRVLADGYGQCNTKGTLLMALLRAVEIPCRLHGFTIHKELQRGAIPSSVLWLAPASILHSWVEVSYDSRWVNLEGFILDKPFLEAVQQLHPGEDGPFCGYAVATNCLAAPPIHWRGEDTYVQREGIDADLGIYDDPDAFYAEHGVNLGGLRKFAYAHLVRHLINRNVAAVRAGRKGAQGAQR